MTVDHTFFTASDGLEIAKYVWLPKDQAPIAIVQIVHGMAEYAARYDHFASFLAERGIVVYAEDHRGHGYTAERNGMHGDFGPEPGWQTVVNDVRTLTEIAAAEFPGIPVFLLGHSMGSFLTRTYISQFGDKISGAILSGTAGNPGITGVAGRWLAKRGVKKHGSDTPSPQLDKLSFGAYNKGIKAPRTKFDWLSIDEANVDKYIADPWCGFVCTNGFYVELLTGLQGIFKKENIQSVPAALPLLFVCGQGDPVGNFGKGVRQSSELYKNAGVEDVELKIFPGARHEILNETNKEEIYDTIHKWISGHIAK